jgi:type IV secretory pathway component VirB8
MLYGNNTDFDWITQSYVENRLNYIKSQTKNKVIKFTLQPGSKKGDNYASDMVQCNIWYQNALGASEVMAIIMKIIPSDEISLRIISESKIYQREIRAYDVISEVEKYLQVIGTKISPR